MMKRKLFYLGLSVGMAALLPSAGFALPSAPPGPPPFPAEFDANSDGKVTAEELQTALTAQFVKIDTNTDSFISLKELQAWHQTKQLEHFNALDVDVSASLSLTEFEAADTKQPVAKASKLFTLIDADANQSLSLEEFTVLEPGKGEVIRQFAATDTNDDSQLSESEFLAGPGPGGPGKGPKQGGKKK